MLSPLTIRDAAPNDIPLILSFVRELAEYEKLLHAVTATEEDLKESLFGPKPYAEVLMAEEGEVPVGFALFFHNYSTFMGKPGMYLEDLYIRPEHRGKQYGKRLLSALAQRAVERGCGRLEWSVLDWNAPAIEFYRKLGAAPQDEWTVYRVTGPTLEALAEG